jgi:hypothetical protein
MKKTILVAVSIISHLIGTSQTKDTTGVFTFYDSSRNEWEAFSVDNITLIDETGKEQICMFAVPIFDGAKISYKGIGVFSNIGEYSCVDRCKIEIHFTDGTIYEKYAWSGQDCTGGALFDKDGNDSTILQKIVQSIIFTNGETNKTYMHKVKSEFMASYLQRMRKAFKNNEYKLVDKATAFSL